MPQLLRDFIQETGNLRQEVARLGTIHVNSRPDREKIQAHVDKYFRAVRPAVVAAMGPDVLVSNVDTVDLLMHDILALSHKRTTTETFKHLFADLKRTLIELETDATCGTPESAGGLSVMPIDTRIIETLTGLMPSAALAYEQALVDLADEHRKSYRGPATDLREALREALDHLAPDSEVMSQRGFRLETGLTVPTMKQKVRYVLSHRGVTGTFSETSERAAEAVDSAIGAFVRSVYTRSSVSTHIPTDRSEVLRVRDLVRVVLCELLAIPTA